MTMKNIALCTALLLSGLFASPLPAEESPALTIAVASNFMEAMDAIVAAYEVQTGKKVQTVYSSTGKLYVQITNGAPYDLFLAADAERPELLAKEVLCEEPFVYAVGEAVLWSKNTSLAVEQHWQDVVVRDDIRKIAVSSPQTAPYGAAALAAVKGKVFAAAIEKKLVYGQNVAQAFQFAFHGSADLAFTALSFALSNEGRRGVYWQIPEAEKVVQKGCVPKGTKNKDGVAAFLDFFHGQRARSILTEFGYK